MIVARASLDFYFGHFDRFVLILRNEFSSGERSHLKMVSIANAFPVELVRRQAAHFKDQLRLAVVEDSDLRVRGLALVGITEPATDTDDALGKGGAGNRPAGFV